MRLNHLNPSPNQLATLSLLCILLDAAFFLLPAPAHIHPSGGITIAVMALFIFCLSLPLWAVTRIKTGVRLELWPDSQLITLRRLTVTRLYTSLMFVLLAVFLLFSVLNLFHFIHNQVGWSAYLVAMYLIQLRGATRPLTTTSRPPLVDWTTVPPLQSSHWGER